MFDFIDRNAILVFCLMAALIVLLAALWIAWAIKQRNHQREKDFNSNRDMEMLRVRIGELEKEIAQMHEHEAQMLAERDSILMAAHEKADDILEQTMQRVQKSESQIRQNRIIASCCITDARRRISDLLIECPSAWSSRMETCSMPKRSRPRPLRTPKRRKSWQRRTLSA